MFETTEASRTSPAALAAERRTATMTSVATALPEGRLTTTELAERFGLSEDWIVSRTGVVSRPRARADERLSDYAARAGADALAQSGITAAELDLVIVATLTQDEVTPNAAPLIVSALGADRAGGFDVGAACNAFLTGLSLASAQVESGRADHVLVIGADFITRITDYEDKKTAPLFADGVGATVVSLADPARRTGRIGRILLGADGNPAITIEHADRLVQMDGPEVFKHAVARMSEATLQAVVAEGLTLEEIDLFVYHQANQRITKALGERLNLDPTKVVDCIATIGNSSAATLPLALAAAQADGRLRPGAKVLLSAFGGGFVWGAGVVEWGARLDA